MFVLGLHCLMADLYSLYRMVTLKIRSRPPKSNQLFLLSPQFTYANLVKIHPQVQKIVHGKSETKLWGRQ